MRARLRPALACPKFPAGKGRRAFIHQQVAKDLNAEIIIGIRAVGKESEDRRSPAVAAGRTVYCINAAPGAEAGSSC